LDSGGRGGLSLTPQVGPLVFGRRQVVGGRVEPAMVPDGDPVGRRDLNFLDRAPAGPPVDEPAGTGRAGRSAAGAGTVVETRQDRVAPAGPSACIRRQVRSRPTDTPCARYADRHGPHVLALTLSSDIRQ
jgi:hypothetical protein